MAWRVQVSDGQKSSLPNRKFRPKDGYTETKTESSWLQNYEHGYFTLEIILLMWSKLFNEIFWKREKKIHFFWTPPKMILRPNSILYFISTFNLGITRDKISLKLCPKTHSVHHLYNTRTSIFSALCSKKG